MAFFSPQAKSFASGTENLKIILIDGEQLAQLMIGCPGELWRFHGEIISSLALPET